MRRQLLALAIATTAAAQSQTGLIEGMVLDGDGMPLAGAEVTTRSPAIRRCEESYHRRERRVRSSA